MDTALATQMPTVPTNPTPNGTTYTYVSADPGSTYTITFGLEGPTGDLGKGLTTPACTATDTGITCVE
jgi:hypothetical protein